MPAEETHESLWPYAVMALFGLILAAAGIWLAVEGSSQMLGDWGPMVTFGATLIGFLLLIAGAYYFVKNLIRG